MRHPGERGCASLSINLYDVRQMPQQRFYTGYSGQMAVVAELLIRECNAAIPAFDIGTDVFAFRDDREEIARLQVKSARAKQARQSGTWSARFVIPLAVLGEVDIPSLYYVLAVRAGDRWLEFIVISRQRLHEYWKDNDDFGTVDKEGTCLTLTVRCGRGALTCSGIDLTTHRNAWDILPPLEARARVVRPDSTSRKRGRKIR
jgi:hypothetical protein